MCIRDSSRPLQSIGCCVAGRYKSTFVRNCKRNRAATAHTTTAAAVQRHYNSSGTKTPALEGLVFATATVLSFLCMQCSVDNATWPHLRVKFLSDVSYWALSDKWITLPKSPAFQQYLDVKFHWFLAIPSQRLVTNSNFKRNMDLSPTNHQFDSWSDIEFGSVRQPALLRFCRQSLTDSIHLSALAYFIWLRFEILSPMTHRFDTSFALLMLCGTEFALTGTDLFEHFVPLHLPCPACPSGDY